MLSLVAILRLILRLLTIRVGTIMANPLTSRTGLCSTLVAGSLGVRDMISPRYQRPVEFTLPVNMAIRGSLERSQQCLEPSSRHHCH